MQFSARSSPKRINLKDIIKGVIPAVVSLLGTFVALYPANPHNTTLPSRDSGAFLYVGWRLLHGDVPYLNVWDHKPPLVYFLDALGIWITPASLWGIWILQFLFIGLTLFIVYRTLEQTLGNLPALTASILFTSGLLTVMEQGNVTEEYPLLFQAACFLGVLYARRKEYPLRLTFLLGIAGGLAFNFKQTTIGIWCAFAALLLIDRFLQKKLIMLWKDYLVLAAGWLLPSLILGLYFFARGGLGDFWAQAYLYNFSYVQKQTGLSHFLPVISKGVYFLSRGGLLYFAIAGWVAGLMIVWIQRKDHTNAANALLLLALFDLPLELGLLLVSGRSILHYYFTPLLILSILGGTLAYTLPKLVQMITRSFANLPLGTAVSILILGLAIYFQIPQAQNYKDYLQSDSANQYAQVINYISKHTGPQDTVLVVGAESEINFLTRRASPTRYVYQYPLQLLGWRPMVEEYIGQIMENRPKLIIDTDGGKGPDNSYYLTRLEKKSDTVGKGLDFLQTHYSAVATIDGCVVYQLK